MKILGLIFTIMGILNLVGAALIFAQSQSINPMRLLMAASFVVLGWFLLIKDKK